MGNKSKPYLWGTEDFGKLQSIGNHTRRSFNRCQLWVTNGKLWLLDKGFEMKYLCCHLVVQTFVPKLECLNDSKHDPCVLTLGTDREKDFPCQNFHKQIKWNENGWNHVKRNINFGTWQVCPLDMIVCYSQAVQELKISFHCFRDCKTPREEFLSHLLRNERNIDHAHWKTIINDYTYQ